MYGSIGKLGMTAVSCATNQAIAFLKCNRDLIEPRYAFFLLLHERNRFLRAGRGGTQQNISQEFLKAYEVELPDLAEQRRILECLEQADALRRAKRFALDRSTGFLSAVFRRQFGSNLDSGPFKLLGEVARITGGGTPSRSRPDYFEGSIPWLTPKDMRSDYIWHTEEHITEGAIRDSATKLVPAESILVVVKSKVLMHRLPVAIAKVPLCHGQDIKSIQCSSLFHNEYVAFTLRAHERRLIEIARGANTEGLNLAMLEELPIPEVAYEEQLRFVSLVERWSQINASQREELANSQGLFEALLRRTVVSSPMMSGRLTPGITTTN
jgi:type I restriction enzyme S subunit